MKKTNNTPNFKGKQYHLLTYEDRYKIEILVSQLYLNGKKMFNDSYIAKAIGVNRSTISRELRKRIKSKKIYIRLGKITNKTYNVTDAQNDYIFKSGLSI